MKPLEMAVLPRGIDGMFLPAVEGIEPCYAVPEDSLEERWTRCCVDARKVLRYRFRRAVSGFPTTEEILRHSDLHRVLLGAGVRSLLLTATFTPLVRAWSDEHGIRMIASDYREQRQLEDKLRFDSFLARNRLPRPARIAASLRELLASFPARGAVVQKPESMGGEGTYFVRDEQALRRLIAEGTLKLRGRHLIRERVEGRAYGITILVAPGLVALSAVRLQCYLDGGDLKRTFAGIQWVPSRELGPALLERCQRVFLRLGRALHRRRFFGFANVDFMVDASSDIRILECNPRMAASSAQLLRYPELISRVPAGRIFLEGFLGSRPYPERPRVVPLPRTSFAGATLDVPFAPERAGQRYRVPAQFESGIYRMNGRAPQFVRPEARSLSGPRALFVYAPVHAGRILEEETTLAIILSNLRLYDGEGRLNGAGRSLLRHFGRAPCS